MYEISDRGIDRFYGEYERPVRWPMNWPYQDEELDDFEEGDA